MRRILFCAALLTSMVVSVPAMAENGGFYDGEGFFVDTEPFVNGSGAFSGPLLAPDGSASAPAYSYSADTDTGVYRVGANSLGFATGGGLRLSIDDNGIYGVPFYSSADGTAAAPRFSWQSDTDLGLYRAADNTLGIAASGGVLLDAPLDLNGVGRIVFDADGDSYAISPSDDVIDWYLKGNRKLSMNGATAVNAFEFTSGLNKVIFNLFAGVYIKDNLELYFGDLTTPEFWFVYKETSSDDFEFWSTNCDAGTTDCILMRADTGSPDVYFGNLKGAETGVRTKVESVTFAGGGEANKATVGTILPDGAFVTGITSRVTTTGTGCAGYRIGVSGGGDDAQFGEDLAVAVNSTSTNADWTAVISNPVLADSELVVTGTDGGGTPANCVDMVVALTVHYRGHTAATIN